MAKAEDIAHLSMCMRTSYGPLWKNDSAEALQIWANVLSEFGGEQIKRALNMCLDRHMDYPPTLPQFLNLVRAAAAVPPCLPKQDVATVHTILAYGRPLSPDNPYGNTLAVNLPASVAIMRPGETIENYRARIVDGVESAAYPRSPAYNREVTGKLQLDYERD